MKNVLRIGLLSSKVECLKLDKLKKAFSKPRTANNLPTKVHLSGFLRLKAPVEARGYCRFLSLNFLALQPVDIFIPQSQ